jgi:hypothetical protein
MWSYKVETLKSNARGVEMDDESLKNLRAWSMKLYDDFEPVRALIRDHPEMRDEIVKIIGERMTNSFADNFYGPSPHGR